MSLTREKIIELGESFILTKGYNAFSYQDISRELGMKNAAIHYYFPSKANLGTSIVRTNIQRFEEMVENMETRGFSEWQQLESFVKVYIKSNREGKLCLLGSLGPDFATLHENTQKELKKMTDIILNWLTGLLSAGRNNTVFSFRGDAHHYAVRFLSDLVASLQLSRVVSSMDYKAYCNTLLEGLKP